MSDASASGDPDRLAAAQTTIARQEQEIADLRRRLADQALAEELRGVFRLAAAAGTLAAPITHTRLLEVIVATAARVLSAKAASLFLIDEKTQELVFQVGVGGKAEALKNFRIPLGHGIAGLVAVTCQPMIVSDARSDPRQAADIAQAIGYFPGSIFCIPLISGERTIGVLEVLDKEGAASFGGTDMEILGYFGNLAAIAIEQSRTHLDLAGLLGELLASLGQPGGQGKQVTERARAFVANLESDDLAYQQALELARLVREIVEQGDLAFKSCRTILTGFADYLRSHHLPTRHPRAAR